MGVDARQITGFGGALTQVKDLDTYAQAVESRLTSLENGGGGTGTGGGGGTTMPTFKTECTTLASNQQAYVNVVTNGNVVTLKFGIPKGGDGNVGTGTGTGTGTSGGGTSHTDSWWQNEMEKDRQDGLWPKDGYEDTIEGYMSYKMTVLGAGSDGVIPTLGTNWETAVKYGYTGTEAEWNEAIQNLGLGDESNDVTSSWAYGLKAINISTNVPPQNPEPNFATMWAVCGESTQEVNALGNAVGDGTAVGMTVNSNKDNVGFMLAAGYYGLYYRHKIGSGFGTYLSRWGLLKDRYGFTVDSRNITCARIQSFVGLDAATAWRQLWRGCEDGLSCGIVETGSSNDDLRHWFYMALKFRQTEQYNAMYRLQYGDDANKAVRVGTYDGYGMLLAWQWQDAIWWLASYNNDGSIHWDGGLNLGKLHQAGYNG